MTVLFAALHLAYFRNFESVVRALAARGDRVHLAGEQQEAMGGRELAEQLAAEYPTVTWDMLPPLDAEPWFDAARRLRLSLDYVRALEPRYAPKMRLRSAERVSRIVRWSSRVAGRRATRAALTRIERLLPHSDRLVNYLQAIGPDVVVLASLTYSRSQQLDLLKAARRLNLPVAAAIMSWDHLSSKALLHVPPDRVIVWNRLQLAEAVDMHGLPADRVVVTGAQCYDQWFSRQPGRTREAFCSAMGLRPDRPFVLWVHSACSPVPDPPEPVLVLRWLDELRRSEDPCLRELGVLVRPHPERLKEWAGVDLSRFDNVAFHGRNPIDAEARDDYFDSLYHSRAVVGLATSAFLEAAIVGRPVLTLTLPEYRMHQEEMLHFRYLLTVEGGLLHQASDLPAHFRQLRAALALDGARDERNRRFLHAFVRPAGLDVPATPRFVEAIDDLARSGSHPDPSLEAGGWLRPAAAAAAAWARSGPGLWLLKDRRADAVDEHDERRRQARQARLDARARHRRAKARRVWLGERRAAAVTVFKEARSALRRTRFRAATAVHRLLGAARPGRDLPGAGEDR